VRLQQEHCKTPITIAMMIDICNSHELYSHLLTHVMGYFITNHNSLQFYTCQSILPSL
jgi:hypothetical protein